jgi:uncharacterized protein YbbC (DUF1343 family)
MLTGLDRLLADPILRREFGGRRVAVVAHPASTTASGQHALDALVAAGIRPVSAFGPQHGIRGEKQDNMQESADEIDPVLGIPMHSLYGVVRRPTPAMLADCDVVLIDMQDVGCRVYTFLTTLRYVLEAAAEQGRAVVVLDRPNPAGRPVEGLRLEPGQESFVGAGPLPMRHGMTLGELGGWFVRMLGLEIDYRVVTMEGWRPESPPGWGWPFGERSWINPSPNAATPWMARCYAGTVMLEGTTLSEGRGTTRPLEVLGSPDLDGAALLREVERLAPAWMAGCRLRPCWFEPVFHKHAGRRCGGLQIHVDDTAYEHHAFRPWRLVAAVFKAVRQLQPTVPLWRDFVYEYEADRLAIDVINGGDRLRRWVDDAAARPADLEACASADERSWHEEREPFLLYR